MRRKPGLRLIYSEGKPIEHEGDFSLVLCFSRKWCVHNFFVFFNKLRMPIDNCHLIIYDNTDDEQLKKMLIERIMIYKDIFRSLSYWKSYRRPNVVSALDEIWKGQVDITKSKLPVIYQMHLDIVDIIPTQRFIIMEDDTLVPKYAVEKLLKTLDKYPRCGVACAIETGRGTNINRPTRLGVHIIKRQGNRIIERLSLPPNLKGKILVDGCGWYCTASYRDLWKKSLLDMKKYFKDIPRFGMDNLHTNNIKQMGYDIIADFSLWCKHMDLDCGKILFWDKSKAVPMLDVWLPEYKTYAQGVVIKWTRTLERKLIRKVK